MSYLRNFELISTAESDAKLPERATATSAGYDFFYNNTEPQIIGPREIKYVPTQVKAKMPKGQYLALYNRSSNPKKKHLILVNGVGIVDSDYYNNPDNEGHIMFAFYNISDEPVTIVKGEKLGQGIFQNFDIIDDDTLKEGNIREGGFGSTNK